MQNLREFETISDTAAYNRNSQDAAPGHLVMGQRNTKPASAHLAPDMLTFR